MVARFVRKSMQTSRLKSLGEQYESAVGYFLTFLIYDLRIKHIKIEWIYMHYIYKNISKY